MENQAKKCAELVHEKLCIATDYGETMPQVDYIVCIDDDATSALYASKIAWKYFMKYNDFPTILCVGGKGLLSRWTHKTTEGEHLADVCRQCGIGERHIVVLDEGRNTGDNILAVAHHVLRNQMHIRVLFVCTKRLSLRLFLTQQKQARKLIAYYYVIEETLEQACKWYNGKRLCNCELMYHELASILDRCEAYAGTFQDPIPFEVPDDVREAANYLAQHYRLKMPRNLWQTIKAVPQFVRAVRSVKAHRDDMEAELATAISQTKSEIAKVTG